MGRFSLRAFVGADYRVYASVGARGMKPEPAKTLWTAGWKS